MGTIMPALVDSGACDNFISAQTVAVMHLEVRPLRQATRILSANRQPMECASYVVVTAVLWALSFPLSLWVVPSSIRVILGFPFLHQFNPRISWRSGTLTIEHGSESWCVPTYSVMPVQSEVLAPMVCGEEVFPVIYQPPAARRAALSAPPLELSDSIPPRQAIPPSASSSTLPVNSPSRLLRHDVELVLVSSGPSPDHRPCDFLLDQ